MAQRVGSRKVRDYRRMPRQIALLYALIGSFWVVVSDLVARYLAADESTLSLLQTYKGWLFVLASGLALYFLLRLYTAKSYELMSRLIDAETRFRQFFETVPDVLFSARLPGFELSFVTPSLYGLTGYTAEEALKRPSLWRERLVDSSEVLSTMREQLEEDGSFTVDCQIRHKDGSARWIRSRGRTSSGGGTHATVFGVMTDITEIKQAERQAVDRCLRDSLTNLLSPPAFALGLDTLISGAHKHELLLSCACLGIDDFPQLRRQHGERRMQQLLLRLSRQLLNTLRTHMLIGSGVNILVARADDRFLFVMPERSVAAMINLAQRLLTDLDRALSEERDIGAVAVRIGIASHPLPGEDADAFIEHAMDALEAAREDTHTRVMLYNVLERERITEETALLRRAH